MSPENTIFSFLSSSVSQISILLDPRRCPASTKRTSIPSAGLIILSYGHLTKFRRTPIASSIVYAGINSGFPSLRPLRFLHSASNIWICALSRSMISQRLQVLAAATGKAPRRETKITFRHPAPQMRMAESVRHTHLSFDRSPLPHTTRRRRSGGPAGK